MGGNSDDDNEFNWSLYDFVNMALPSRLSGEVFGDEGIYDATGNATPWVAGNTVDDMILSVDRARFVTRLRHWGQGEVESGSHIIEGVDT